MMKRALGHALKSRLSVALYLGGVGLAFVSVWAADLVYAGVALLWLVPDRRMATAIAHG